MSVLSARLLRIIALLAFITPVPAADFSAGVPATIPPTTRYDFKSAITGIAYRIWLKGPATVDPNTAYPVLYALDGNATAGAAFKTSGPAAILVFIGYPTEISADVNRQRELDLTFSESTPANAFSTPPAGAKSGGGDAFARVIEEEIKPFVASHFKIDPARQSSWGHSPGGLEVLRIFFRNPGAFSAYGISSPSIWWNNREILKDEDSFSKRARAGEFHARVLILSAGDEQPEGSPERMIDNATALAERLQALGPAVSVTRKIIPDETHGSVVTASYEKFRRFVGKQ